MRALSRGLLSHWCLLACGAGAFFLATPSAGDRDRVRLTPDARRAAGTMIAGTVGIPVDANTRLVPSPAEQAITLPAVSNWTINYTGFSAPAQAAFQHAINIWSSRVNSSVPIVVNARFTSLSGFLAVAGFVQSTRDFTNAPLSSVWFPIPVANARVGSDLDVANVDITVDFNSNIANFYFGTDGNTPAGQYDFVTLALHELLHGLGFGGSLRVNGANGQWGNGTAFPFVYDYYTVNGASQQLVNTGLFANPSPALSAQLRSNDLFWNGPAGTAGNGGLRPQMYAPTTWAQGSSHVHLDETAYPPGTPNSLMTYALNTAESNHLPSAAIMGMLTDFGWVPDSCTYQLQPSSTVNVPAGGVTGGSVNLVTGAGCPWSITNNSSSFVTLTSPASGTGSITITFNVSANGGAARNGTMTVAGQTLTIAQSGAGPTMAFDKSSLRFGAITNGAAFTTKTTAQTVRLTQSGAGTVTWTASTNRSWLQVSPPSGSGPAVLTIDVSAAGAPVGNTDTGAVTLVFTGAGTVPSPINVTLRTFFNGTSADPIGVVDTPVNGQTGVTGAIAMTGWSVDDVQVDRIAICRAPVTGESAPPNGNCGGAPQIFIGFGLFIDGARPDVMAAFPTYPLNSRGGWGHMVLTNMLPNQGNGTYVFSYWSTDNEGHVVLLGTRTITCANSSATLPFGAIDTPTQGGTASGSNYINFGWVLAGQPMGRSIPTNGSTISVLIDGSPIGGVDSYNNFRSDIAALFPGYVNSNGAVGVKTINTTALTNGVHTIAWLASDNLGATQGIGSRFFTVANGGGSVGVPLNGAARSAAQTIASDRSAIVGRRGWDLSAPWTSYAIGANGRALVRGEELDRFELALGTNASERHSGFLRAGEDLLPLPIGSRLDARTGNFTWAPGVGFIGTYDLVFVRTRGAAVVGRQDVRIVLHPKGRGYVGPQVVIDAPRAQQDVAQPFMLGGWAADLEAGEGTGVSGLHVWAYPLGGGPPVFLGAASYGGARADVGALHGERFRDSGYGLIVHGLTPGNYDLAVFAWSTEESDFVPAKVVRVTIR
ncbi:MAG TPA: BACON domain-containing carbohydrate-binding protein [Vicinamibacterales bacterium]